MRDKWIQKWKDLKEWLSKGFAFVQLSNFGLGFRTIKTGLAVYVCLLLAYITSYPSPMTACTAAIICMQDLPQKSWESGKRRLVGIGAASLISLFFLLIYASAPYQLLRISLIPLAVIIGISFSFFIGYKENCALCAILIASTLYDATSGADWPLQVLVNMAETTAGVVIAAVINRYIKPMKHEYAERDEQSKPDGDRVETNGNKPNDERPEENGSKNT